MSLMSYRGLMHLVMDGVVRGADPEQVNASSIDIRLGQAIMVERSSDAYGDEPYLVDVSERQGLIMDKFYMGSEGYTLEPGEFILAQSLETFHLPSTISAEYKLKSSMARAGLEHLNAGWCDSGWAGSVLTLELKNMTRSHALRIKPGMLIGQMVFFAHEIVPHDRSYATRGRYNNDTEVTGVKL